VHNPLDRFTASLPRSVRLLVDWFVTVAIAVGVVLALKEWVVNPYRIPSASMEPTLHCAAPTTGCAAVRSDRVLANRFVYHFRDPRRGDVVVFETPLNARRLCGAGGVFVKRLIGLPGEVVSERDGVIFIDGKRLEEPYIRPERRDTESGGWNVPEDGYFLLGDNRRQSCDSRRWGAVKREALIGPVFATYWPFDRLDLS
jgi:signal peptidase I